jgi:dTDP-4-amino-4,6-dideoxygalactose transaminase
LSLGKIKPTDLAILGGPVAFPAPLPVGQLNFPDWRRFEEAMRGIFARRDYTDHGPLAQQLEAKLAEFLRVKHVVCVANATIGLMAAAVALGLRGKVILPAFTFIASAQSLTWAGISPVFCDVDPHTHQMDPEQAAALMNKDISAIMGVHLWGNPCFPDEFRELARDHNVPLYFDAAHAFGCTAGSKPIGNFGALEVFSFHATKVLNAAEGGCVCTNDDGLAERLRTIACIDSTKRIDIPLSGNGRMSEAQAALGLLSLEDYPKVQRRNRDYHEAYHRLLGGFPGLRFQSPPSGELSNYQYVVMEISADEFGLDRDTLWSILQAENVISRRYFSPGIHRSYYYRDNYPEFVNSLPVTDRLCECVMQLPSGQDMDLEKISRVCELIWFVHRNAKALKSIAKRPVQ